jgi:ribonucleoside-diphosphate reductase alpha chain
MTSTPSPIVSESAILEDGRDLGFADNAIRVLEKRYLVRNEKGEIVESPKGMYRRVARALAEIEKEYGANDEQVTFWENQFYGVMANFQFTPAGRTVTNAGGPTRVVANCIVLHFDDSMDGIFQTLRDASLLQQAGSGLGFAWHLLRPAGKRTVTSRGTASGPVSFLRAYDQAFGVIKQQSRHGANMGVMRVDHPDILEFIDCKRKEGDIVNFNISVGMTDEFMQKVKSNDPSPWLCEWEGKKMKPRIMKRNNRSVYVSHEDVTLTARELMNKIVDAAWHNGEPGVLFPDAANRSNPVPHLGRLEATNPCGEQWLHDGDVCNLGSINLAQFATAEKTLDEDNLRRVTRISTRMLDNVIDVSDFPVEKVNERFRDNRRVGLGIMGFADLLYQLEVPYDSPEGFAMAKRVMKIVDDTANDESQTLAQQKGTFPNWEKSIFGPAGKNVPMRNAALTTVAPTGSISMLFDCSSGIEPFFALAYKKENIMGGESLAYFNKYVEKALKDRGLYSEELVADVVAKGSIQHRDDLPEDLRRVFVTAMDIAAKDHIAAQAAFQEHVDNSISKTINFSRDATREDVLAGYIQAWEAGCKGCTVYRDGSRDEQVLSLHGSEKEKEDATASAKKPATEGIGPTPHHIAPRPRPHRTFGATYKIKTGYGQLYVTINSDAEGQPFEVFATIGKTGGVFAAKSEAICRMISLSLRSGIECDAIIRQLKGIRGPMPSWGPNGSVLSIPDAIAQIMDEHIKAGQGKLEFTTPKQLEEPPSITMKERAPVAQAKAAPVAPSQDEKVALADLGLSPLCPDCNNMLVFSEGCASCRACGFSRCG